MNIEITDEVKANIYDQEITTQESGYNVFYSEQYDCFFFFPGFHFTNVLQNPNDLKQALDVSKDDYQFIRVKWL